MMHGRLHIHKLHQLYSLQARYVVTQSTGRHLLRFLDLCGVEQKQSNRPINALLCGMSTLTTN